MLCTRSRHRARAFAVVAAPFLLALSACGSDGSNAGLTDPSTRRISGFPTHDDLRAELQAIVQAGNGGLGFNMWATIIDRGGVVRDVVFSGDSPVDQWPGSRVISAQKANTANAFSLTGFALSTANLYAAVQPGGSLFGLQESNPVDPEVAYDGKLEDFGTIKDPLIGQRPGGVNVFGGGLALYTPGGKLVGAIGVSGDTSCADHNIAWRARNTLNLDYVPNGVAAIFGGDPTHKDNIIFDIAPQPGQMPGISPSGFGHPHCGPGAPGGENALAAGLPPTR
jgi:uncharacterized protein GlcG (DUF336 family)